MIQVSQGDRYGRLIIIREVERRNNRRYFLCHCDCGNERVIPLGTMRQGKARSCGCYTQEVKTLHNKTDRIDVNGNYEPSNCRWATPKEQQNNKRNNVSITYNGETKTLKEWSEVLGMSKTTLRYRLKSGNWNIEKAFSKEVNHYGKTQ